MCTPSSRLDLPRWQATRRDDRRSLPPRPPCRPMNSAARNRYLRHPCQRSCRRPRQLPHLPRRKRGANEHARRCQAVDAMDGVHPAPCRKPGGTLPRLRHRGPTARQRHRSQWNGGPPRNCPARSSNKARTNQAQLGHGPRLRRQRNRRPASSPWLTLRLPTGRRAGIVRPRQLCQPAPRDS